MRVRKEHTWVTKQEMKSFIEAWAKCCSEENLNERQRKALMRFKIWAIDKDGLVKSYVYSDISTICEQLGIEGPVYKENDAYYIYWKDETKKARWKTFRKNAMDESLGSFGIDYPTLELKLTSPSDRVTDVENRVEAMADLMIEMAENMESLRSRVAELEKQLGVRTKPDLSLVKT